MTNIIFAKPVHKYDSYQDFWRLVELSGFETIRVDEIDLTKEAVIITAPMNGDYQEYMVGDLPTFQDTGEIRGGEITRQKESGLPRMAHLIIWNLERPSGSAGSVPGYANACYKWLYSRLIDEIWVSDPSLADECQLRYVTLGSDYGLGGDSNTVKKYDFCHMSAIIPRRSSIYSKFADYQIGPNAWGDKRHEVLTHTRFAVNVHQDNYPFIEPLRIALYAAYGLPIISETVKNSFPYGSDIMQHGYHGLVSGIKSALNDDYKRFEEMGNRLKKLLCDDLQFGKMVRRAIEDTAGKEWR